MEEIKTIPPVEQPSTLSIVRLFIPTIILIAVIALVAFNQLDLTPAAKGVDTTIPISEEIEEKYGIRFTYLALSANGGLVDLRYRVVDAEKAKNFGHDRETAPMLVAEDSGKTLETTIMGFHNHRVEPSHVYYVLYRNTGNAIRPGEKVTIAIGDLTLSHVLAR
jgi:hypothetical protein